MLRHIFVEFASESPNASFMKALGNRKLEICNRKLVVFSLSVSSVYTLILN